MTRHDLRSVNVWGEREEQEYPLRVYLRVRPLNKFEISRRSRHCIQVHQNDMDGTTRATIDSPYEGPYDFSFDQIFDENSTQQHIYPSVAKSLIDKVTSGYNCALLMYGTSQSGKTHTLIGTQNRIKTVSETRDPTSVVQQENYPAGPPCQTVQDNPTIDNESNGIVQNFIRDLFSSLTQLKDSSSLEISVKCSYIEVYMEAVRDLLNPNQTFAHILDSFTSGTRLMGVSQIRCRNEIDALSLLDRGIAFRTILEARKQSDLRQSHSIFTIHLEQTCAFSGRTITSHIHFVDLAASDWTKRPPHRGEYNKTMNTAATALNAVVKSLTEKAGNRLDIPYQQSTLTRILQNVLGGNCISSIICTVSPASFNIEDTLACARFGEKCKGIRNLAVRNIFFSPEEAMNLLRDVKNKEDQPSNRQRLEMDTVDASPETTFCSESTETIESLKLQLDRMTRLQENMDNTLIGLQSEILILRHENECLLDEKKKAAIDLLTIQSDMQELQRRKAEVEANLRTSQFRESEATVFLRQFRIFYRRLLQNKTSKGSGYSSQLFASPPGVPGIQDMVDIDTLLWRSGLLEDEEVDSDGKMSSKYRPSSQALTRSSLAAANFETPSETLQAQDTLFLELELKAVVEKSCALHIALEEAQSTIELLSNNDGSVAKLRLAEESLYLKKVLEEKENDLQAIIWKMNELNLVNKTYDKKLSNLAEHMKYLSDVLDGTQAEFRDTIESNRSINLKLQDEIHHLSSLVNALTVTTSNGSACLPPLPIDFNVCPMVPSGMVDVENFMLMTRGNNLSSVIHSDKPSTQSCTNIAEVNDDNITSESDSDYENDECNNLLQKTIDQWSQYPEEAFYVGAKPNTYTPVRFTTKFGPQIRLGTFQDYIQLVKC